MKLVFMGTPDFAVPCLDALINAGHEVAAVFTQPDKPKNRGHKMTPPPVKECAVKHSITVLQPEKIKNNIDFRVCGRADDVLSQIILDKTDANDLISKTAQGRFLTNTDVLFQAYYFDDKSNW